MDKLDYDGSLDASYHGERGHDFSKKQLLSKTHFII